MVLFETAADLAPLLIGLFALAMLLPALAVFMKVRRSTMPPALRSDVSWTPVPRPPGVEYAARRSPSVDLSGVLRWPSPIRLLLFGAVSALSVGVAGGYGAPAGLAVAAFIALMVAAVYRPSSIVHILLASLFLEVLAFGGVAIGRLLAPIALFVILLEIIRGGASLRSGVPLIAAMGYATWALASGIWSYDLSRTMLLLGSLSVAFAYMLVVAVMITSERVLRRSLLVIAVVSMLVGVFSVASYAGLPGAIGAALEEGRAQGGLTSPNYYASLQLVAVPLIAVVATEARTVWQRYALYGCALITLGSVLTTLSRGGLFALLVLLVAMILAPWRTLFPAPRQKAAVVLVLALALGAFLSRPHLRYELTDRVLTLFAAKTEEDADPSGSGRTELWNAAKHSISERPIFGLGFGAFYSQAPKLLLETPGVRRDLVAIEEKEVHNAYLGTTAELGVPGLTFFLGILLATAMALRRAAKAARRLGAHFVGRVANALLLSLLAWSITAFFIEAETARPLWIIVGFSLALPALLQMRAQEARRTIGARNGRAPGAGQARSRPGTDGAKRESAVLTESTPN